MTNLVIMKDQQAVTSSLQVAESFGKEHRAVLKAIDDLKEGLAQKYADLFWEDTYVHPQNKQPYRVVYMNRDGFTLAALGFNNTQKVLDFKLKYIEAFNQMESHITKQPQLPTSPRQLARLALEANEETNQRIDHINERLVDIEENKLITTEDKGTVDRAVQKKVYQICKDQHLDQGAKSMLFQDLGSSIKQLFSVPNRGRIKDKDFPKVLSFIDNWQPSSVTKERINQIQTELEM